MRIIIDDENGMRHVHQPLPLLEGVSRSAGVLAKYRARCHAGRLKLAIDMVSFP
jgi:hypothetical protein